MRTVLFALLTLVCCASAAAQPATHYLPRAGWAEDGEGWEFYEDWLGKQLSAMGEPSLLDQSAQRPATPTFRVFVAPTFSPAYAIRITERSDGSGIASYVLLDGEGGYFPGRVQRRATRYVSRPMMRDLRDKFDASGFWTLPITQPLPAQPDDGADHEIVLCSDGTNYLFEAVADGRHHAVMPDHCPDISARFAALLATFRKAAGLRP